MSKDKQEGVPVGKVSSGDGKKRAKTGKPRKIIVGSMRSRYAAVGSMANTVQGYGGNFYSPELSTDFLELPQSLHEKWAYYRFFYENEPFVGQALNLHVELPISKIRIGIPKAKNREIALAATRFCTKWARRVRLVERLMSMVHERNLIGEAFVWFEDENPEMPQEVRHEARRTLTTEGEAVEEWVLREDADQRASKWLRKNYKGWTDVRCLPPEQIRFESFNFTSEMLFEVIPDSKTKRIVDRAKQGDPQAQRVVKTMSADVVRACVEGRNVPLNTDPDAGSFIYYLANKRSDYQARGTSILQRCIRALVYRDKLRQAQTSIASRHMTPIRIVWGEDMSEGDVEDLREQVDMALMDPDYSIITNFQVNWEEMGADQRLLDLNGEYDLTDRQLYAGLSVTEGLLSGESSYSGDRANLEVINTRYMLLREQLQAFVEDFVFRPMCARMGFIEKDEDGEDVVVVPSLTFTRLALRDNRDTFDALYNLYTKGSLDVETILELLNLDPVLVRERIERDLWTVNDPTFNEVLRGIYGDAGRELVGSTNILEVLAKALKLEYNPPSDDGDGRF